jgi:hypothetical protein
MQSQEAGTLEVLIAGSVGDALQAAIHSGPPGRLILRI